MGAAAVRSRCAGAAGGSNSGVGGAGSGWGSAGPGLLAMDATNLVALLNSVEDAGLIERRRDRTDRRRAIIELSQEGERLLADLDRALRKIDEEMLSTLTGVERDSLNALLARALEDL